MFKDMRDHEATFGSLPAFVCDAYYVQPFS